MADNGDFYDRILSAQTSFFTAIDKVRQEMSEDSKSMRKELLDTFQNAHKENKDNMALIAATQLAHSAKDDKMFARVNWIIACAIGGGSALIWILDKTIFK